MLERQQHQILIRRINGGDWPAILAIQAAAYGSDLVEAENVLRAKAAASPETCLLAADAAGQPAGYLLAHPHPAGEWLALGSAGPSVPSSVSDNLLLHDLAVRPGMAGRGVGVRLFRHLEALAIRRGVPGLSLVAVQGAAAFWERLGFAVLGPAPADKGYDAAAVLMCKTL